MISTHAAGLQARFLDHSPDLGRLLNPLDSAPHARFLAFESSRSAAMQAALARRGVTTDVRDDVLRIGFGLYHDAADVDRLAAILRDLA